MPRITGRLAPGPNVGGGHPGRPLRVSPRLPFCRSVSSSPSSTLLGVAGDSLPSGLAVITWEGNSLGRPSAPSVSRNDQAGQRQWRERPERTGREKAGRGHCGLHGHGSDFFRPSRTQALPGGRATGSDRCIYWDVILFLFVSVDPRSHSAWRRADVQRQCPHACRRRGTGKFRSQEFSAKTPESSQESPLSQPLHSAIRWCLAPAEWA